MSEYVRMTRQGGMCKSSVYSLDFQEYMCGDDIVEKRNSGLVQQLIERLADFEDKLENGTLKFMPCEVGTTIYHLYTAGDVITEDKVFSYHFEICSKPCVSFENHFWYGTEKRVDTILVEHFGKYWFTDKAKAEAKLRELKEKD